MLPIRSLKLMRFGARAYSTHIGNRRLNELRPDAYKPPRWKKHWFLQMQRKREIEGPEEEIPRGNRENWDYKSELAAFKCRLQIDCDDDLLGQSLSQQTTEEDTGQQLFTRGELFTNQFVCHYVNLAYPLVPEECKTAIQNFLLDTNNLSHIAFHLGYQDLSQSYEYPPSAELLASFFLSSIEVIRQGDGGAIAAGKFLLDFIVPQLVGKDILHNIWKPSNPMGLLTDEMKARSKKQPEARLVRQTGVNTMLPAYFVSLFSGEELLAESAAESIPLAELDAAKLALKDLYEIKVSSRVRPMGSSISDEFLQKLFQPHLGKENSQNIETEKLNCTN